MLRNVKIARLSRRLRDELNRRLAANEDGATLLEWINAVPVVKDLLARDFAGEPITIQNLLEWRRGGFAEWQTRQDLFAAAADLTDANGEWDALAANDFAERLAAVLLVRYADALAGWNGGDDEAFRLKLRDLRRFNQDLAVLRRYNQTAARLKMEQMRLFQAEGQRPTARTSTRKPSTAGAHAGDDRFAPTAGSVACSAPAGFATSTTSPASSPPGPGAVVAAPANAAVRSATDPAVAGAAVVVSLAGSSRTDRLGLSSGNELCTAGAVIAAPGEVQPGAKPTFGRPDSMAPAFRASCDQSPAINSPGIDAAPVAAAPVSTEVQPAAKPGDAGKSGAGRPIGAGVASLAAGLIRASLVIKFADSLSNASTIIKEKSVHAFNLKDRRAVQSAYAGSVATANRLGIEAGLLRAELTGFADVDRVAAAVAVLQREYPLMKSNLFQGFPAALTAGIQQMRDAAYELRETLQRMTAPGVSQAVQPA
jgi:hypothetical protein